MNRFALPTLLLAAALAGPAAGQTPPPPTPTAPAAGQNATEKPILLTQLPNLSSLLVNRNSKNTYFMVATQSDLAANVIAFSWQDSAAIVLPVSLGTPPFGETGLAIGPGGRVIGDPNKWTTYPAASIDKAGKFQSNHALFVAKDHGACIEFRFTRVGKPELWRGSDSLLVVLYFGDGILGVNGSDQNYATTAQPTVFKQQLEDLSKYKDRGLQVVAFPFKPMGDDYEFMFTLTAPKGNDNEAPPPVAIHRELVPVDFDCFNQGLGNGAKLSFSVGIDGGAVRRNDVYAVAPNPVLDPTLKTGTVTRVRNDVDFQSLALSHYSIWKRGDWLFGPTLGVATDFTNSTFPFVGASLTYGKQSRVSLSLGWEFGDAGRLYGYREGQTGVSVGTALTQPKFGWSGPVLALTWNFSTASTGGGTASTKGN